MAKSAAIHAEGKLTSRELFAFYGTTALVIAAESVVVKLFIAGQFVMALGGHVLLMSALAVWVYSQRNGNQNRYFMLLLLILSTGAGPFGAAICMVGALGYAWVHKTTAQPADWIAAFFAEGDDRESTKLHDRITFGQDHPNAANAVEPFEDILTWGTVRQKQMAIAKIARYFRPSFAQLLLKAAQDPNAAVRVQAATALAKIERSFMMQYMQLEKSLKEVPDHHPSKLALAELYDDYAYAGLLDELSLKTLRAKAIRMYEAYLSHHDHPEIKLRLARLYIRQDQPEKTRTLLRPTIIRGEIGTQVLSWYMEALFRLKNFAEMRQVVKQLKGLPFGQGKFSPEVENVLRAWRLPELNMPERGMQPHAG